MITLYHSGGARDFEILTETLSIDEWSNLKRNTGRLLEARQFSQAAEILRDSNFNLFDATNNFGDEFCVLYKTLPIEQYVELEEQTLTSTDLLPYRHIALTITDLGPFIRFISVGIEQENGVEPVAVPEPRFTSEVIERALADSVELLNNRGATSSFDRIHTAFHGYLRKICAEADLEVEENANLTTLFSQIRNNHPTFLDLGTREDDILRILRSFSAIVDSVNTLRNRTSVVHPNPILLEEAEAMLVINCIRTLFHYIDSKI